MGWHIEIIDNTVKVNKKLAKALFDSQDFKGEHWYDIEEVSYEGKLHFNYDHMEHMDWLWNENVQKVLCEAKVRGKVTFGSMDGDNSGEFWGYEFDGKGGFRELKGEVVWK